MSEEEDNQQYHPPTEKEIWFSVFMHFLNRLPSKDTDNSVAVASDRADEAIQRFKLRFP